MRSDKQSLGVFVLFSQISNDMITKVKFSQQTNSFAKLHLPNTVPKGEIRSKQEPQLQQSIGTEGLNDCESASSNPKAPGVSISWIAVHYKCGAKQEIPCEPRKYQNKTQTKTTCKKTLITNAILCCLNYSIININCYETFTKFPSSAAEYPRPKYNKSRQVWLLSHLWNNPQLSELFRVCGGEILHPQLKPSAALMFKMISMVLHLKFHCKLPLQASIWTKARAIVFLSVWVHLFQHVYRSERW